jgi:lysozyme family protein
MSDFEDKQRAALADLETVRRGFSAKVEAMRSKVTAWAEDNARPPGNDDAAMTDALLEVAIERLLAVVSDKTEAFEFVEDVFKKVVRKPAADEPTT